jgi:predicted ATPase
MADGRFQRAVIRGGGANAFLHYGSSTTSSISVELRFGRNGYHCVWESSVEDRLFFSQEEIRFWDLNVVPEFGDPHVERIGSGSNETQLLNKTGVGFQVLGHLKTWRVYHFHDTSDTADVKKIRDINDNAYLRRDAGNLASFLYRLQKTHPKHYRNLIHAIRQVAPFFEDFYLRPLPEDQTKIQLEWKDTNSDYPFLAHYLSDGTLRFICLATVLLQPSLPATILIDEPELGLHPYALSVLAGLMKRAAAKTQLIVSTQSVPFIDYFNPEDLLVVDRKDHATTIKRVDTERLADWLAEYSLSDLWEKNVLGGRP